MKKLMLLSLALLFVLACGEKTTPVHQKPMTVAGEKTYTLTGKILSRNAEKNQINTDHDEIPGFMGAMEMPYEVRGVKVSELPTDGSRFRATLHVTDDAYWLTGVTAER